MGDSYRYPIFFESPGLDEEQNKKIENYFRICRKSGGGDCSSVTKINDNIYSIAFKEQGAQQRVLQKSEHVLEFAGCPLVLTVHSSISLINTSTSGQSVSSKQDSSQQRQHSVLASSLPPSGEDYELRHDAYLLRYLTECPNVWKELERELSAMSCSAQLYPQEGRVVVRSLAQPGAVDEVRDWKAEVDRLFKNYLCHYEVNPHKIKALLQSCSSCQTIDEVKVYSEVGVAVVVGECSQVNARLVDVENATVKSQGSRLSEKQTSTVRLGEAKLHLLWKELDYSLGRDFPGVKVSKGDAGHLVLEGSVEEILEATDCISKKESLVFERPVSDKSPHFLAFLRNSYGSPGKLGEFLGVDGKVEIELRDTELRLFTLSADKLNDTEKTLWDKFKEVKLDVPNCSSVPSELQMKLKSKVNQMNQGQCRAQVLFGLDSTVCLLGHTEEVEELSEMVAQFILDQATIEGSVILPFQELLQLLPELLQLHGFDYSGVVFHPLPFSSEPIVALKGPSSKVTEVRNRLGPFLDSVVQDKVIIDLPGAERYFASPSGRDKLLNVARLQKCLIQLQKQPRIPQCNLASGVTAVASYSLCDGLQVLVCQGDITKQEADALVNAANENLDHGGGVAAALSKAGGPEVQMESKALVKCNGKVHTGDVVVTTGGNLKCKKLLHAVGPVGGQARGKERDLLEKTVQSALKLAETMEFKSIAIPCISSGLFGVPVTVCCEAIVTAVKIFGSQGGRSLRRIILIDNSGEVVRAMQETCGRLLQGISPGNSTPSDLGFQMGAAAQHTARGAPAGGSVHIEVIQGTIETQQVDVLVSPMAGHSPCSTRIGNILSNVVGSELSAKFEKEAAGGVTLPGDIILVEGLAGLQSKAVIFLNLAPWHNSQHDNAVQVLRQGIRKILASCSIKRYSSVALSVLGTGAVLKFPHSLASRVILEEVKVFDQDRASASPFLIRIIIHPNDRESSMAFQSAQDTLHLRGFTNDANPDQASFYRHVSATNDEITAMLGGVRLQMVLGDITNEGTDVIVNTTDFSNNPAGVSKAILTAAGPAVQAELAQVGIPLDPMCTTGAGFLGCRKIIHARFMGDPQVIRKNCKKILKKCERERYCSVAFPAINTGAGGMDSVEACKAMLDGMVSAVRDLKPKFLSLIRIVILQQPIFQAFRSELENRFGQIAPPRLNRKEKAKQILKKWIGKQSRTSTSSAPEEYPLISSKPQPAIMSVICRRSDTMTIKRDLERILQNQLDEREVDVCDLSRLSDMELEAVKANIRVLGISVERRRHLPSESVSSNRARSTAGAEAKAHSGSGKDVYVLKGLKEDVLSITELVNRAVNKALCEDLQDKNEAMLALSIQWSIQDINGVWNELSLHDNYILEDAYINNLVFVDLKAPDGMNVKVNLTKQQATDLITGITYQVKRVETGTALDLPPQWEPMHNEVFKKVEIQPNSPEYQTVAQGFHRTATYNIQKIERVQNLYLWQAYTVCRERILAKNGPAELGEKSLYHGTSAESCMCIERDKFDRSFAGAHAAMYGMGVYFAVNAGYSASRYSPPDASGLKRLYVARVLTGRYTVGRSTMKATPPRGTDSTDCFDSLVDNQQQPSMFVIFHDDQAYPEYLITFN